MSGSNRVAGVVLAAGFSRRLGRPKQDVVLGGETLLERAVQVALAAGLKPVFAVLQPGRRVPGGAMPVENGEAQEGMAASVRAGVQAAAACGATGVVLMTCDQVALTLEHLRSLCAEPESPAGSRYGGRVGIPAYFPAGVFPELLCLHGDTGARGLLQGKRTVADERLKLDIDTEADLEQAVRLMQVKTGSTLAQ